MTEERRGGGRRGKAARGSSLIPQLPWRAVENPYPPLELASPEQMEAIHRTSIRILSELGVQVMGDRVMDLFAGAGAIVDRGENTLRIDESLVRGALKSAPEQFTLCSHNPTKWVSPSHISTQEIVWGHGRGIG